MFDVHHIPQGDWVEHNEQLDCPCGPSLSLELDEAFSVYYFAVRHVLLKSDSAWGAP